MSQKRQLLTFAEYHFVLSPPHISHHIVQHHVGVGTMTVILCGQVQ